MTRIWPPAPRPRWIDYFETSFLERIFQVTAYKAFRSYYIAQAFISSQKWGEAMAVFQRSLKYSAEVMLQLSLQGSLTTLVFQAKKAPSQDASLVKELELLEKAIEGRQFVAHANSILETEATTEKVTIEDQNQTESLFRLDGRP